MNTKEKQTYFDERMLGDFLEFPCFIPTQAPYLSLPEPYQVYIRLLDKLHEVNTEAMGGVRKLLDEGLSGHDPELSDIVRLNYWQQEKLFSVLSVLAHCYRWNYLPPAPDEYLRTRMEFPPAIWRPLAFLADLLGHPRCGTMWSMKMLNFQIKGTAPGQPIVLDTAQFDQLTLSHSWVPSAYRGYLEQWIRIFVLTEVEGTIANKAVLQLLKAVQEDRYDQVFEGLELLHEGIVRITSVFNREVRGQRLSIDHWRNYIQPTFIWGLVSDESGLPLEGVSGLQVGCIQLIDLVLGSKMESKMGQSMLASRKYFPRPFRELLDYLEHFRNHLHDYIKEKESPLLISRFNQCVEALEAYRISHKQRGKVYIKGDGSPKAITTTGLSVTYSQEAVQHFEADMEERIKETIALKH